jgi:hypothetical protein
MKRATEGVVRKFEREDAKMDKKLVKKLKKDVHKKKKSKG